MSHIECLSNRDVIERRARGLGNDVPIQSSRTYLQILRRNAFTFINSVLFVISLILIALQRPDDAVVTFGLVLMNVVVGVVQEGRSKRTLDRIALLTRPKATVIRDGHEQIVDPSEIVLGDVIVVRPGDQIVVDGSVVGDGHMDADESLLTGESDLVPKQAGDAVYSGSFCVTGDAVYEAEKVGPESLMYRLTAGARAFRDVLTPLQRDINFAIRMMVLLAVQLGILLGLATLIKELPIVERVQIAAVIVALVPQGLLFMTTLTYALGAVRMAGKGALIQQANAVESMSNVDVLCLDKTGTLTTNRIRLHAMRPLSAQEEDVASILGDYVVNASGGNHTSEAIAAAFTGQTRHISDEVPFSSARKWSALAMDDPARRGVYVLGAPEMLQPHLHNNADMGSQTDTWTASGLRVLLFASRSEVTVLHDEDGQPQLPRNLIPMCLLSFSDELRADAKETIRGFEETGIRLKIISGDNPDTVSALAKQVGFEHETQVVSGMELADVDESQFTQIAKKATIFGRITPQQKERLVRVLQDQGNYVGMIGDGVNDVLSLKQAHLGIAMQSGSQATRSVADLVLLNDSFAALPAAFREGQRIVKGMQDIIRLFLSRTLYVTFLVIATSIVGVAFPVTPKHNSILALLTVGIPTLALAAWAKPGRLPRRLLRSVVHFVLPAAFSIAAVSLGVYLFYLQNGGDLPTARTALTTTTVLCGLLLILFVEPPAQAWVGGDMLSGDWRPTFLALGMLVLYIAIMLIPSMRTFFELMPLQSLDWLRIFAVVTLWAIVLRSAWRAHIFQRLLNMEFE